MSTEYSSEAVTELTPLDRKILASYKDLVDGLADYLGFGYEFVLHSLENFDHSVIKIINGYYTGRNEGAPITDLAMKMLLDIRNENSAVYKSYFTVNKNGAPMKSTTIGIKGEKGTIIGLLCINFYLETSLANVIDNFIPTDRKSTIVVKENYPSSIGELVSNVVSEIKEEILNDTSIPPGRKNGEIVRRLDNQGYFSIKDSVPQAAEILKISKTTIYMHLRRLHGK
jgi:predicted transcriptional regulator YheO